MTHVLEKKEKIAPKNEQLLSYDNVFVGNHKTYLHYYHNVINTILGLMKNAPFKYIKKSSLLRESIQSTAQSIIFME